MQVFIATPEGKLGSVIQQVLADQNFPCQRVNYGKGLLSHASNQAFDAAIVDLAVSDAGGLNTLRALRMAQVRLPILVVSRHGASDLRLKALDAGADDFMQYPLAGPELVARLRTIIRRHNGHSSSRIQLGNLAVDLETASASFAGRRLILTKSEYRVLEVLALQKGRAVSEEDLMQKLYHGNDMPKPGIISVFIAALRSKLFAASSNPCWIRKIYGYGYILG